MFDFFRRKEGEKFSAPNKPDTKREVAERIDATVAKLKIDNSEMEEVVFENQEKDNFAVAIRGILNSAKQQVLNDEFISAEYQNPLNKQLIDETISTTLASTQDQSSNAWRARLGELLNNNDDEGITEFKSKVAKQIAEKIIDKLNKTFENGTATQ